MKNIRGFTLIELVMVILIASALAEGGYYIMQFMVQNTFYLPNQVQTDLAAAQALETLVEGDTATVHGLRFSRTVTALAPNDVTVKDQDCGDLRFWLDTANHQLKRQIGVGGAETVVPYFMPPSVSFTGSGVGDAFFTYYDGSEVETNDPTKVRRIQINLIAQQGAGSVDSFQGISRQNTSVKVSKYTCV